MIKVETSRVRTVAMNNTDNDIVINIVKSNEFKKFIKELYKDDNVSAYQISNDICLAMNETQTGAFLAIPLESDSICMEILNSRYDLSDDKYNSNTISTSPTDKFHDVLSYIDNAFIEEINNRE